MLLGNLQYVLSRRGKPQLLYKGYLFNSDSICNGRTYWRCSETRRGSCMSRLVTTAVSIDEKQPYHDHPPKMSRVEGKKELSAYSYSQFVMTLDKKRKDIRKLEDFLSDDELMN